MDIFTKNNVKVIGSAKQVMIFSHGFGCDQQMWKQIVPAFQQQYQIILFDHVGAGKSLLSAYDPIKYASLDGYAEDVLEICQALSLSKAIFVGHSVSAMIGVLAAIKEPAYFDKLILVAPSPCYINHESEGYVGGFTQPDIQDLLEAMDRNYLGWSNYIASLIIANPNQPQLSQELSNSFCRTNPDIARQFARATFLADNRSDLAKLTLATLTLQCSQDIIAPLAVGQYMHRHLAKDTLTVLKATGHCPHMSAPQETIQAIQHYLSSY